jgi:DNA-binding response OmpR family regulator
MTARILLVSDDAVLLSHLKQILEARGHTVESATSLQVGLEAAALERPDLLVLDGTLPGRNEDWIKYDGEFMKALGGSDNPLRPRVLILYLRGQAGDFIMDLNASPDGYCQRPEAIRSIEDYRGLLHLIERLLSAQFPYWTRN